MRLTDKRFWKFEAIMLLCGLISFVQLCIILICNSAEIDSGTGAILVLLLPAFILYFTFCSVPVWLLYDGNSWLKLAGYLYLISALLLIALLLIFIYDWNPETANMRPEGISQDEGKYITDNELVTIVSIIWSITLIVPVLITSYLTKRWVMKEGKTDRSIIDSANRALKGNVMPNVRAIAMRYNRNQLTLKCYLDTQPSEPDHEMLSDIVGEILSDFPSNKIPQITEECMYSDEQISKLDKLDLFIYIRNNEQ